MGFHFNLTFGLKPQVGGFKIVRDCLQTIHFPSWVAHSHFDYEVHTSTLLTIYSRIDSKVCSQIGQRHSWWNASRFTLYLGGGGADYSLNFGAKLQP